MRRTTKETDIEVELDVEGTVETGDPVLNHLLMALFHYMGRNARS